MAEPARFTMAQLRDLAGRGLGKIDLWGPRGASLVSTDELIAMATALAILGLKPVPSGSAPPAPIDQPVHPLKGPADV